VAEAEDKRTTGHFRTTVTVSYESKTYVLSLIKWSLLRKILSKIFRANPHRFTPSYELAIYEIPSFMSNPQSRFSWWSRFWYTLRYYLGKEIDYLTLFGLDLNDPYFVFHFANKNIAFKRLKWIAELIKEGGARNIITNLKGLDYSKEGIYSDFADYVERPMDGGTKG